MVLFIFLLVQPVVFGQLTVGIDTRYHCIQSEILVPVLVTDFDDVVSITFYIDVDTANLQYEALVNPNALLNGGILLDSFTSTNGNYVIGVTWTRFSPISITSGKLFDLKFMYKGESAVLHFSEDCEIALSDLSVVENVIYQDGIIQPMMIISNPQNQTVVENNPVKFSITQQGATAFQWQKNSGNGWNNLSESQGFSGYNTHELSMNNVPVEFDSHLFRCLVTLDDCTLTSDSAVLLVKPTGIFSGFDRSSVLTVYPVPCSDILNFVVNTSIRNARYQLVNLLGKTVYQSPVTDFDKGSVQAIFTGNLQPGFYFLQLIGENSLLSTVKVLKQ
jgi:hypothetical protein